MGISIAEKELWYVLFTSRHGHPVKVPCCGYYGALKYARWVVEENMAQSKPHIYKYNGVRRHG